MNKPQTFIFVGRSGSGKGTQIELLKGYLADKYKDTPVRAIVMGEIYREFFKEEGYVQNIARDVSMNQGKFQPDFLTNGLFVRSVMDIIDDKSTFFFDGYPRTIKQLEIIKELLQYVKREDPIVINIDVSRENVKERMLLRGRGDDSEGAIESRLNEYDKFILPMLEVIKSDSFFKYLEINGEGKIEDIHTDIVSKLNI
ncbi:MAG TPA: nucleoside monophosphate kinase [Candidatus Paceibacterota bacterium]|nr:nucleoside monophosphate kinase [Candidatus Paceibacterota bacterium]